MRDAGMLSYYEPQQPVLFVANSEDIKARTKSSNTSGAYVIVDPTP